MPPCARVRADRCGVAAHFSHRGDIPEDQCGLVLLLNGAAGLYPSAAVASHAGAAKYAMWHGYYSVTIKKGNDVWHAINLRGLADRWSFNPKRHVVFRIDFLASHQRPGPNHRQAGSGLQWVVVCLPASRNAVKQVSLRASSPVGSP